MSAVMDDRGKRVRSKNLALALTLAVLAALFFAVTLVRLGAWQ